MSISRSTGQFSGYILVKGLITAGEAEHEALKSFTDDERVTATLAIQLELSRAVMGYQSQHNVLEDITIFKRVPITPSLHEEEIARLMWEVEAMLGSIFIVSAMAAHKSRISRDTHIKI